MYKFTQKFKKTSEITLYLKKKRKENWKKLLKEKNEETTPKKKRFCLLLERSKKIFFFHNLFLLFYYYSSPICYWRLLYFFLQKIYNFFVNHFPIQVSLLIRKINYHNFLWTKRLFLIYHHILFLTLFLPFFLE